MGDDKAYRATVCFGARLGDRRPRRRAGAGSGARPGAGGGRSGPGRVPRAYRAAAAGLQRPEGRRPAGLPAGRRARNPGRSAAAAGDDPSRSSWWSGTARIRIGRRRSLEVECGAGTYIRSLARDLGERLGCGAYLGGADPHRQRPVRAGGGALARTRCAAAAAEGPEALAALLLPIDAGLDGIPDAGSTGRGDCRRRAASRSRPRHRPQRRARGPRCGSWPRTAPWSAWARGRAAGSCPRRSSWRRRSADRGPRARGRPERRRARTRGGPRSGPLTRRSRGCASWTRATGWSWCPASRPQRQSGPALRGRGRLRRASPRPPVPASRAAAGRSARRGTAGGDHLRRPSRGADRGPGAAAACATRTSVSSASRPAGVEVTVVQHFDHALRITSYDDFVARHPGAGGTRRVRHDRPTPPSATSAAAPPQTLAALGEREGFAVTVVPSFLSTASRSAARRSAVASRRGTWPARAAFGRSLGVTGRRGAPREIAESGEVPGVAVAFELPVCLPPDGRYSVLARACMGAGQPAVPASGPDMAEVTRRLSASDDGSAVRPGGRSRIVFTAAAPGR